MEFLERLEADGEEERWLVQSPGAPEPHVAWIFFGHDEDRLVRIQHATRPFHGPIHPRISTILGSSWLDRRLVFEVDDDRGPSLITAAAQLTDRAERERWVISQIIAIADGLATLRGRDRSFVYRQLEPQRLFIDLQGHAKLRAPIAHVLQGPRPNMTGSATVLGTPGFLSPEQVRGTPVDAATDVFALASILYTALAGRRPFESEQPMQELVAIITNEPPPLETVVPNVEQVLARAFQKDASARTPDPGTFAGELWQCVPDATDYDAVSSDTIVTWRVTWRASAPAEPSYTRMLAPAKCGMQWEQLAPTTQPGVRHCTSCRQNVVHARSISAIVPLLGQHCVAYRGGD